MWKAFIYKLRGRKTLEILAEQWSEALGIWRSPILLVVREERLELSRVSPLDPKSSASANSATLAGIPFRDQPCASFTLIKHLGNALKAISDQRKP
jgi:hypothetical protein